MPRLLPLLVALAASLACLPAEEHSQGPTSVTPSDVPLKGITATTSSRANVRYGPSKNSRPVLTLNAGETVEIIGPAPVADWYTIRFPQKGQSWVNKKNLIAVDDGKRWKVTADGVKARDDSTLRGNIVAVLSTGEILEDRASSRGDWIAVYIPSAWAYVHKSVLNIPDQAAIDQQKQLGSKLQDIWDKAQLAYAEDWVKIQKDRTYALTVDWAPLLSQLDQVAKGHPEPGVRMSAQRLHDAIAAVAGAAKEVHNQPEDPANRPHSDVPGTGTTAGSTPDVPDHKTDVGEHLRVPEGSDTTPETIKPPQLPQTSAPASFAATGFISENTDYPKVPAKYLVIDANSNVIAFLALKAASQLNLGAFDWRWVGVQGTPAALDQSLHGLGKNIPLIEVEDVRLLK